MPVSDYETTAANNDGAGKLFPEGAFASELNDKLRQLQADLRAFANDPDFFAYGDGSGDATINVLSGTQFRITGSDQRTAYHVNRRIRATGAATGTIYGTITIAAFTSGNTDVTVKWDSGSLAVEAVEISLGSLSASQNSGFPRKLAGDFELIGDMKAANLVRPAGKVTFEDFASRTELSGTSSVQAHTFTISKEKDSTDLMVEVFLSYLDRANTNKVTSFSINIGSLQRRFTVPATPTGSETFNIASGKARFTGLSAGTQTVKINFERIGGPITFVVNPSSTDSPVLSGVAARSSFTVTEF